MSENTDKEDPVESTEDIISGGYGEDLTGVVIGEDGSDLDYDHLLRHTVVSGAEGYGKTTTVLNILTQMANDGYGFCYIDLKGDGAKRLRDQIPKHRHDDIITYTLDTSVDDLLLTHAVNNGKIVVADFGSSVGRSMSHGKCKEKKSALTMETVEKTATAVRQRSKIETTYEKPFYLAIDGVEDVDLQAIGLLDFIPKARSYGCGLLVSGLVGIADEQVRESLLSNTSTHICFSQPDPDTAEVFSPVLDRSTENEYDVDPEKELMSLPRFTAFVTQSKPSGRTTTKQEMLPAVSP